jgi:sulfotransferase family protein
VPEDTSLELGVYRPQERPPSIRVALRQARRSSRRRAELLTRFARTSPTFLIIGAKKTGTSSFFRYLVRHPGVLGSSTKETHFFSREYGRGPDWYRSYFPLRATVGLARRRVGVPPAIGEATPAYLFHPLAPARAYEFDPSLKLIAIVRDPVDRAYSDYWHLRLKRVDETFEEAIEREPERISGELERMAEDPAYFSKAWDYTYLSRGRYMEQLERWLELFPREELLVLATEELSGDPAQSVTAAARFLGLPERPAATDRYRRYNSRPYPAMNPETREQLAAYFEEPNRRLYEFLGRDLGWTRPAGSSRPSATAEARA